MIGQKELYLTRVAGTQEKAEFSLQVNISTQG
jgi:hypothetical protein